MHPDSRYNTLAKSRLSVLSKDAWEKACKEDKFYSYKNFTIAYPESEFVQKAEDRMHWLKANKADVDILYEKSVSATIALYRYERSTFFQETGGKAGFNLKTTDIYIRAPSGKVWTDPSWKGEVSVKPNSSAMYNERVDWSENYADGNYHAIWTGVIQSHMNR